MTIYTRKNHQKHTENPDWLNSINFRLESPQGTVYVQIIEKDVGKIEKMIVNVGKAGSSINAMCAAVAELVTKMTKSGISITDCIVTLSGITSDKVIKSNGMVIHSPVDAVIVALMQYRSSIPNEIKGKARFMSQRRLG